MYGKPAPVGSWFFDWLGYHQFLHGSKFWVRADDAEAPKFYQGWIEEFERIRITDDDARRVSRLLQGHKAPSPDAQLRWVKDQYFAMRQADRAKESLPSGSGVTAEEMHASERSRDCPECTGPDGRPTGFARRRMEVKGLPWCLFVDLYCRCPLGRYRERTTTVDHDGRRRLDRELGPDRHYADLRLRMDLWDGRLHHDSWDYSEPDELPAHEPDGTWRYLTPREAEAYRAPNAQALAEIKRAVVVAAPKPPPTPRAAWPAGDPILDRERSAPAPITPAPAPIAVPPDEDDGEMIPF